jgi:hypothetical protein
VGQDQAADRPGGEADRKSRERGQGGDEFRLPSEEHLVEDECGRCPEQKEVVPLQYRPDDGCRRDPLAVALLIDEDLVSLDTMAVNVQLDGLPRSRPIGREPESLQLSSGICGPERKPIQVATGLDNDRLVDPLIGTLSPEKSAV